MKKILASFMTIAFMLFGFVALSVAPASAGEPKNITICHANNGVKEFTQNVVSKSSITKKGHGDHEGDIIPPFTWNDGGNDFGTYPGLNWTIDSAAFVNNDCKTPAPSLIPVSPIKPELIPATCINPQGSITVPEQPAGIAVNTSKLVGTPEQPVWSVTYTITDSSVYTFADGLPNSYVIPVNIVGPEDPMWSVEKGMCNLPDTGMSTSTTNALMITGGLILVAGAFLMLATRRKTTQA